MIQSYHKTRKKSSISSSAHPSSPSNRHAASTSDSKPVRSAEPTRRTHTTRRAVIVAVILELVTVVAATICVYYAYQQGHTAGVSDQRAVIEQSAKALADAVSTKSAYLPQFQQLMQNVPTEVNTDGIAKYLDNLDQLIDSISHDSSLPDQLRDELQQILKEYQDAWTTFQTDYAAASSPNASNPNTGTDPSTAGSSDANTSDDLDASFAKLQSAAADASSKLTDAFNRQIRSAAEQL